MNRIALALALAALPVAASAAPSFVMYAPLSERWFPKIHVETGTSIDVQLLNGDDVATDAKAIIADPRWVMTTYTSAGTAHVVLKPTAALPLTQMLTIPAIHHSYHVLIESGPQEGSAYTLVFVENRQSQPAPTPSPTVVSVAACVAPLFTNYRVSGDKRIPVASVCDDGVRTYIIMRPGTRGADATPYRVDVGGKQDQLVNPLYVAGQFEWVVAGTYEHLAMLTDSSKGQIRVNIDRVGK